MKKSVSFVIPENLFSEEDYASAVALQEAETSNDSDDEHDYARTLSGAPSLPPLLEPNANSSVFHLAYCHLSLLSYPPPADLSWLLLWGDNDDGVVCDCLAPFVSNSVFKIRSSG